MAATMNKEARRRKVRTYEGVQWFDHGDDLWVAAIPCTNMAVERHKDEKSNTFQAWVVVAIEGEPAWRWYVAGGRGLPWVHVRGSVKSISRDVQVLRAFVDGRSPHGVA